ncbi:MAG: hypothetical protein Q9187_003470 [Circinaria calcarea]
MFISTKRHREEDEEELSDLRNEHKKPRALPFRTSPTIKHTFLFSQSSRSFPKPATLTPAESSEDDDDYTSTRRYSTRSRHESAQLTAKSIMHIDAEADQDSDLDMLDFQPPDSPLWSRMQSPLAGSMSPTRRPFPTTEHLARDGTRIATPIYGHFNHSDRYSTHPSTAFFTSHDPSSTAHSLFHRRHALPSPISEDESMDSPTNTTGCLLRRLDMNHQTPNHLNTHTPVTTPDTSPTETPFGDAVMATNEPPIREQRRGAIVGGPPGKAILSMGFRGDCEKCRQKVPGHWSHVLRV